MNQEQRVSKILPEHVGWILRSFGESLCRKIICVGESIFIAKSGGSENAFCTAGDYLISPPLPPKEKPSERLKRDHPTVLWHEGMMDLLNEFDARIEALEKGK